MSNDLTILGIILGLFLSIAFLSSAMNVIFGADNDTNAVGSQDLLPENAPTSISFFLGFITSLYSIGVWDASGNIPVWLNALLFIPRFLFVIVIYRIVVHGGG